MIFGYNLDRALWAMISGSVENRNDIAYFIKTLPNEIYQDVLDSLEKKSHGKFSIVKKELNIFPVIKYHYEIDICNSNLILKVHRWNTYLNRNDVTEHVKDEEYFCLTLNMLYLPLTRNVEKEYIGSFLAMSSSHIYENGVYKGIAYKSTTGNYDLIGTPLGNIVRCKSGNTTSISKINFHKKMPKDIFRTDFESEDRVNNLVRTNKRGRK